MRRLKSVEIPPTPANPRPAARGRIEPELRPKSELDVPGSLGCTIRGIRVRPCTWPLTWPHTQAGRRDPSLAAPTTVRGLSLWRFDLGGLDLHVTIVRLFWPPQSV